MRNAVAVSLFLLTLSVVPAAEAATPRVLTFTLGNTQDTSEGSGGVVIVQLSRKHRTKTVLVDYEMVAGTATPGDDYVVASGTLRFKPRKLTKTIPISIPNDMAPESAETFEVVLSNARRAELPADPSVTITIADDAPGAGELVINELMVHPSATSKEYAEIINVSTRTLDLGEATVSDADGTVSCQTAREVSPGQTAVYSADSSAASTPCALFPLLSDSGDTVNLWTGAVGSTLLDTVTYDVTFNTTNYSWGVDPGQATTAGNDNESNWCQASGTSVYDGTNYGSPGSANPSCA